MTDSEVTLLPEPDSPTIASVSPGKTSNERSRTTGSQSSSPRNEVVRFFTSSTGRRGVAAGAVMIEVMLFLRQIQVGKLTATGGKHRLRRKAEIFIKREGVPHFAIARQAFDKLIHHAVGERHQVWPGNRRQFRRQITGLYHHDLSSMWIQPQRGEITDVVIRPAAR